MDIEDKNRYRSVLDEIRNATARASDALSKGDDSELFERAEDIFFAARELKMAMAEKRL